MNPRTIRDFTTDTNLWSIVDAWAQQSGYRLKESLPTSRLYQRGHGFLTAPMMLSISQTGNQVHLEAWIHANLLARLMALFLLPAEMGIESGGFRAVVPRNIARGAVNQLLAQWGQPPIP